MKGQVRFIPCSLAGREQAGRIPGSLQLRLRQKHRHTHPRNPRQGWAPRKLGQRFQHILV